MFGLNDQLLDLATLKINNLTWLSFGLILGFLPPFWPKIDFRLRGVKFFITNLDHLLGLNYPENLSSIRLG